MPSPCEQWVAPPTGYSSAWVNATPTLANAKPPNSAWPSSGTAVQKEIHRAFTVSGEFYDFFFNRFGRDSYDGAGGALISTVRYCGGSVSVRNYIPR